MRRLRRLPGSTACPLRPRTWWRRRCAPARLVREVLHGRVVAVVDDGARHLHVEAVDHVHRFRRAARRQGRVHHFGLLVRRRGRGGSGRCRGRARRIALGQRERARTQATDSVTVSSATTQVRRQGCFFMIRLLRTRGAGRVRIPRPLREMRRRQPQTLRHRGLAAETGAKFACQVVRRITRSSSTSSAGRKHVTSVSDSSAPRASRKPRLDTADMLDENPSAKPQ